MKSLGFFFFLLSSCALADYPRGDADKILDFSNWVSGVANRELDIVNTSATVDTITYKNPDGTTSFVIQVTYSDAAHSGVTQVKRTL